MIDVLANDGPGLTLDSIPVAPLNGTVSIEDDLVTYTPSPDFNGADTFTYRACDTAGTCGEASVDITVLPVPDPPVANDDFEFFLWLPRVTIDVLANDTDPDGDLDPTTLAIVTPPSTGQASVENGSIVYEPVFSFLGRATIEYQVCDLTGLCDTATVTLRWFIAG